MSLAQPNHDAMAICGAKGNVRKIEKYYSKNPNGDWEFVSLCKFTKNGIYIDEDDAIYTRENGYIKTKKKQGLFSSTISYFYTDDWFLSGVKGNGLIDVFYNYELNELGVPLSEVMIIDYKQTKNEYSDYNYDYNYNWIYRKVTRDGDSFYEKRIISYWDNEQLVSTGNTSSHDSQKHETIDLGLSFYLSETNFGALNPWEIGEYIAWGEIENNKTEFSTATYNFYEEDPVTKNSKYYDLGDALDSSVDIVTNIWGDGWRIPSNEELCVLAELCTWAKITYKDVNGYKVTGPNGKSIFLPLTGIKKGTFLMDTQKGYYWSSDLDYRTNEKADCLIIDGDLHGTDSANRFCGLCIRPVKDK